MTPQRMLRAVGRLLTKFEADCFEAWTASPDTEARERIYFKMKAASEFTDFVTANLETELDDDRTTE